MLMKPRPAAQHQHHHQQILINQANKHYHQQEQPEEASTHKSAMTHTGNIFVTRDLDLSPKYE